MSAMVDLHTHLLPAVDDGARDAEEAGAAVRALSDAGVSAALATPHLEASELERGAEERLAAFDHAWRELKAARDEAGVELRLARGAELRLDGGAVDDLDERVRLGTSRAVLVEFASLKLPPFGARQLEELSRAGWVPVLAHPERYRAVGRNIEAAESWREAGAVLQVNAGSLIGQYGKSAREAARKLVARGWAGCLASDFHARGPTRWGAAREAWSAAAVDEAAARDAWELLVWINPARVLRDEEPLSVPSVGLTPGLWGRLRGFLNH